MTAIHGSRENLSVGPIGDLHLLLQRENQAQGLRLYIAAECGVMKIIAGVTHGYYDCIRVARKPSESETTVPLQVSHAPCGSIFKSTIHGQALHC